jgi:uncharacterized membrane protein
MKKSLLILLGVFVLTLFLTVISISADTIEDQHGKQLEIVLEEIRERYGIGPDEAINPRKVSDEDLEEVGEAVMSIMHPDPAVHRLMDDMMGGEGTESVASMHRAMGYNYLSGNVNRGFSQNRRGPGFGGMMSPGMMGGGMMGYGMMGQGSMFFPFGGWIMWILIIVVIGVVVYLVTRVQKTGSATGTSSNREETALDIVKKRYARGEISKDEYESIKQNL